MRTLLWDTKLSALKTILTGLLFSVYCFEQLLAVAEMICFNLPQLQAKQFSNGVLVGDAFVVPVPDRNGSLTNLGQIQQMLHARF